mgnify:CR=1 FL=1
MKKNITLITFLLCSLISWAQIPAGYYNTATGTGLTLKTNLKKIIDNVNLEEKIYEAFKEDNFLNESVIPSFIFPKVDIFGFNSSTDLAVSLKAPRPLKTAPISIPKPIFIYQPLGYNFYYLL